VAVALDFTYRYPFASSIGLVGTELGVSLATCDAKRAHPHFFSGKMRQPKVVSDMLLALCQVVRTHFFIARPPRLDPVVTSSPEMLRFEGFSGCCGVYARADLPGHAFDRDVQGRGTTNVDFNDAMRASLARLRDNDDAQLHVGREGVELEVAGQKVIEKKVKLPVRWIKGFSEVQAYQPGLQLRIEVPAAEARRFLRSLPSGVGPKRVSYVVQSGAALRLTHLKRPGAVPLEGMNRVRVIEPLMTDARSLRIWTDDESGTSGWEVPFATGRFFLMLSPELRRGFSGEGQVLAKLASRRWQEALPYVQSQLAWQTQIDTAAMASKIGLPLEEVEAAMAVLGSRGLAGYDVEAGRYFHRELPFDLERIEALQPRLKDARDLLATGGVAILTDLGEGDFDMGVQGTGVRHHVRLRSDGDRCTCPWFSKYQGERGPCKHVLAARMFVEDSEQENEP
jgi:hypothetical protein